MPKKAIGIVGTGSGIPEQVLTNFDLEKMVETSDEWIRTRTGIRERRIAAPHQATSDLAYEAAKKALESAGVAGEEVELIIVATITPDMIFPATACLLQDRLGAKKAAAFDLSAGCSGFIYSLEAAANFLLAGKYQTALVIGADLLSRITNWRDRSTCVLFGDGAAAAVLRPVEEPLGFLSTVLGADGSGAEKLYMPAGGSRKPARRETVEAEEHYIRMCGPDVFKFAVRVIEEATLEVLRKAHLEVKDVDLFIPHQANIRIIDAAAERLGLDRERVVVNVDRYGNTSAASVGLALDEAVRAGRLKKGDVALLVGFGAGLTWGASVLRWAY